MPDTDTSLGRVAILWRGDEAARRVATPESSRFRAIFAALADVGVAAIPVVYEDDVLDAVARQLAKLDGVLVWVNPIHEGRNRATLDALLRDLAKRGVWVSAHPDVITKMGTKEVLYHTRTMSWGCDTAIYRTAEAMRVELPLRLVAGPRVIKRNRGNGGQGVWKVELLTSTRNRPMVRVLDATRETSNELALEAFVESCIEYFADGCVIDQAFQARLSDGVVRCYMVGNRCAGFGYQKVKALIDSPAARAEASQRRYSPKSEPRFQHLRRLMEDKWTPQLTSLLGISARDLPMIWDADFMLGSSRPDGSDSYVLGEINVSSVFPVPDEAPREIALRVADRLRKQGHPPAVDPRIQNPFPTRDTPP
ncbi:Cj0069 family protein [Pseudorhodoplanes sp.]|uniref:Cj0069 family protein n=1 Tax=Pseudorhodoplanes sp. TaxID=1934341 RepID=UPI00391B2B13